LFAILGIVGSRPVFALELKEEAHPRTQFAASSTEEPTASRPSDDLSTITSSTEKRAAESKKLADASTKQPTFSPSSRRQRRPHFFDVNLSAGLSFGGATLASGELTDGSDRTLRAGTGVILSLGGKLTPVWIGDCIGFGAGVDFGWKYGSMTASDGAITLTRFPLVGTIHGLLRVSSDWFIFVAGGLVYEVDVSVSSSGVLAGTNAKADNALGELAEAGLRYVEDEFGVDIKLRYTSLEYRFESGTFSANNGGFYLGLVYLF
jgi:hypothetical protein